MYSPSRRLATYEAALVSLLFTHLLLLQRRSSVRSFVCLDVDGTGRGSSNIARTRPRTFNIAFGRYTTGYEMHREGVRVFSCDSSVVVGAKDKVTTEKLIIRVVFAIIRIVFAIIVVDVGVLWGGGGGESGRRTNDIPVRRFVRYSLACAT